MTMKTAEAELGQLKTALLYLADQWAKVYAPLYARDAQVDPMGGEWASGKAEAFRSNAVALRHLVNAVEALGAEALADQVRAIVSEALGAGLKEATRS